MKSVSLVLLLVASALSAPTEEAKPVQEVKEVVEPEARALTATPLATVPLGATLYQPYQQQQFGARLTPYYQPQYQYLAGQQHSYIHGAPTQTFVSGTPYYYHGAQGAKYYQGNHGAQYYQGGLANQYYQDGAYYPGGAAHFAHPAGVYQTKKVVQPAPVVVKTHAAPVPAHIVKTVVPAAAAAAIHHEYDRFAAPAVVRAHAAPAHVPAPAHIVKAAHPVPHPAAVEPYHVIVKQANDDNFDGTFAYSYETDHGIAVESSGYLKNAGTPDQVQVMQGSYTYYTPEGVPIVTTYIADENGFQVQGDHLPVPPAMPEAIAKSIEYQRSLPPSAEDIIEQERAKAYAKF